MLYQYLCDVEKQVDWRPELAGMELVAGAAGRAGTTYREHIRMDEGDVDTLVTVNQVRCPERLEIIATAEYLSYLLRFDLFPEDENTRLVTTIRLSTNAPITADRERTIWGAVTRSVDRALALLEQAFAENA